VPISPKPTLSAKVPAGIQGTQTATVQLVDEKTQDVAWAYNVRKGSATAYQSTAEAVAKHLKEFLEKHPQ
jgi:hypothetical protein